MLESIQRFTAVLRDPQASRESKQEALRFLVHFVGDIHQPLHVGRRADRGGNSIPVTLFGQETNLHSVWDTGLVDSEKLSFSEFAAFIDHPTLQELQTWQAGRWQEQTMRLLVAQFVPLGADLSFLLRQPSLDAETELTDRWNRLDEPIKDFVRHAQRRGALRAAAPPIISTAATRRDRTGSASGCACWPDSAASTCSRSSRRRRIRARDGRGSRGRRCPSPGRP